MNVHPNFLLKNKPKPILKWAGGKSSLLPKFLENFPQNFETYLEPFLGGASVFLSLSPRIPAIINDSHPELFNLYSVLSLFPQELCEILDTYAAQYSQEFYYDLRKSKIENSIERAARTLFLNKTGFNGLFRHNSKGEFNVPFGKRQKCPTLYDLKNILLVSAKLRQAKLFQYDFEVIFSMSKAGDFIYCDPPYEPLSRTSSFNHYQGGGFSQYDQKRLYSCAKEAASRGVMVAISNSCSDFILNLYKEDKIFRIPARRSINSNGQKRGIIEEVLTLISASSP